MDVRVIEVENSGRVWISVASIEKLRQYHDTAAEIVKTSHLNNSHEDKHLYKGHLCIVYSNNVWARGEINRLYTSSVWNKLAEVTLIDYGKTFTVPFANLVNIEGSYMAHEAPLARSYYLSPLSTLPVNPTDGRAWSEVVMEIITNVGGPSDEWGVMLKGSIERDGSLQLFNEEKQVNINQLLIRKGLLTFNEESIKLNKSLQEREFASSPSPPPPLLSSLSPSCSFSSLHSSLTSHSLITDQNQTKKEYYSTREGSLTSVSNSNQLHSMSVKSPQKIKDVSLSVSSLSLSPVPPSLTSPKHQVPSSTDHSLRSTVSPQKANSISTPFSSSPLSSPQHRTTSNKKVLLKDETKLKSRAPAPYSYVTPLSGSKSKYLESLKQYLPPQPKVNYGVYIKGSPLSDHRVWPTLEDTPFDSAICKSLRERGFQFPTSIQSNGWSYIWSGCDTILCSPPSSGKTLTYLLPLLISVVRKEKEWKHDGNTAVKNNYQPKIIVLVNDSFSAWNISEQARTVLGWLDASKRFRSCPLYATIESEAHIHILNGIDILCATPPALSRFINKGIVTFRSVKHLVLDDVTTLMTNFKTEVNHIYTLLNHLKVTCQIIACSHTYNSLHWSLIKQLMIGADPVTVCTDMVEMLVLKKQKLRFMYCEVDQLDAQLLNLIKRIGEGGKGTAVVCVRDEQEGNKLLRLFSLHCLSVSLWSNSSQAFSNITIITDKSLPLLIKSFSSNLSNISSLIHYTLPSNKALFTKRISLLLSPIYTHQSPVHIVLCTPRCKGQSRILLSLMERLCEAPPPVLVTMAQERSDEKKRRDPLLEVCPQMKCFGKCGIGDCSQVHTSDDINKISHSKLPLPAVPVNGTVKVIVETVSSPCHLWVRILDHTPLHHGDTPILPNSTHLSQLSMDLALYYSDRTHKVLDTWPSIGDYCSLLCDDGSYYRVKLLEFSRPLGLFFHHKEQAKVHLIDTGEDLIVDVNQLYSLPPNFLTTPPLVIEAFLCGLIPPDNDISWPTTSVSQAQKLLVGHTLTGGVALSLRGSIWLDPVEERLILSNVGVVTAIERPQKEFITSGIALENSEHLTSLKNNLNINNQIKVPLFSDYKTVAPPTGCGLNVVLTAVEGPDHFYVQMVSFKKELDEIVERLNYSSSTNLQHRKLDDSLIKVGRVYAAMFPFDNRWYRVCLMERRVNEEEVKESLCFFADYGDCEWVTDSNIALISMELLELPFQAICCQLYDHTSLVLPDDVTERIWDITRDQTLNMELVGSDTYCPTQFPATTRYCVELLIEDNINIMDLLITENSLSCNNETISPPVELEEVTHNDDPCPELTFLLVFLLSEDSRDDIAEEFLPFVLSKQGRVDMNELNCSRLASYLSDNFTNSTSISILRGLLVMAMISKYSVSVMAAHEGLCQSILILLKEATVFNLQLLAVQLIHVLLLSKYDVAFNFEKLSKVICEILANEREGGQREKERRKGGERITFISTCIDALAYLVITNKICVPFELIQNLYDNGLASINIRLISLLLNNQEGCNLLTPHISSVVKDCPQKQRETLLISLLAAKLSFHLLHLDLSTFQPLSPLEHNLHEAIHAVSTSDINTVTTCTDTKQAPAIHSVSTPITANTSIAQVPTVYPLNDTVTSTQVPTIHAVNTPIISTQVSTIHAVNDTVTSTASTQLLIVESDKENNGNISNFIDSGFSSGSGKGSNDIVQINKGTNNNAILDKTSQCMLIPSVLWSQSRDQVILNVPLRGCDDYNITLNDSFLNMWCTADGRKYSFSLELFGDIDKYTPRKDGSGIIIKLYKMTLAFWPRLTHSKDRPSFVGIDHDRWKDSSEDESNEKFSINEEHRKIYSNLSFSSEEDEESFGESDNDEDFENELLDFLPS